MIHSLFPHAFGTYELDYDNHKLLKDLETYDFFDQNPAVTNNSRTRDLDFLENYRDLKNMIIQKVNDYVLEVMKCSVKVKLNSSWATQTDRNSYGGLHYHSNAVLSAVYYPMGNGKDISITFLNPVVHHFKLGVYKNMTPFNMSAYTFYPKSGDLIVFPSYVLHNIDKNVTSGIRYSIASNLIPEEVNGLNDRIEL